MIRLLFLIAALQLSYLPADTFARASERLDKARIALVQYNADLHFGDYVFNLARLTEYANEAVSKGAKIVVFPEGSLYGYADRDFVWCSDARSECGGRKCRKISDAAEKIPDGRTFKYWHQFARRHRVHIVLNEPESDQGHYYNTSAVIGPDGLVAKYHKGILYYVDACYAEAGGEAVSFSTPYGRFGMAICADANDPAMFSRYLKVGADAVILQMDWDQDPNGLDGAHPARTFFQDLAKTAAIDIYASDVSPWDGTGKYSPSFAERERSGLPTVAIGMDGISYHDLR